MDQEKSKNTLLTIKSGPRKVQTYFARAMA